MIKRKRIANLEHRLFELEQKIHDSEILLEIYQDKWSNLDEIIESRMNGKMKVIVVENLAAYQMGKAIKKDVDHIVEVFKIGDAT